MCWGGIRDINPPAWVDRWDCIMKVNEIRKSFLAYFQKKQHTCVPSSSLVPVNDETLLFTNAGMVPFKDLFLGREVRSYSRAASAQRCVRAGGKHNDLENVGYTARHHTFFEMLGNFSFGDYFKREAIAFAWEYLTEVLKLSPEKLWVTVYEEDDEAANIWLNEMKIDKHRFSRCGKKDNFWAMGDTGPCGPCSEIFYDHGPTIAGGPPGSPEADADRYIEIWNLVFMQYNRGADGSLASLPKPSVDTGMGIERLAAVLQGVHSNYEIDLFQHLIQATQAILPPTVMSVEHEKSYRVIADHIRSTAFLMVDGVIPSNEGRGYVLRRIMRRALRHGHQLGATAPFFHRLVKPLADEMGEAYPELEVQCAHIEKIILKEEEQFARTLDQGLRILENDMATLKEHCLPGETVFKLYDTYGFPVDLTADIARERGWQVDLAGFECEMEKQRVRARGASQFSADYHTQAIELAVDTCFTGYERIAEETSIVMILRDNKTVDTLNVGDVGQLVLAHTPFYAESGGQVGDTGIIEGPSGCFVVEDTQKIGNTIVHCGKVERGALSLQAAIHAVVDVPRRQAIRLNHSATHLLHAALREILGMHVMQKGSLVAPDRLRFDFSHFEALTHEQIRAIELRVNEKIIDNTEASVTLMTPEDAIKRGAMALFGEKYGEQVRVLDIGEGYSIELCGGTHVSRTGDIGLFKIVVETGIAAGIRRIEAVTGKGAFARLVQSDDQLEEWAQRLKTTREGVNDKIAQLLDRVKGLEKDNQRLKEKLASGAGRDLSQEVVTVGDIQVLAKVMVEIDLKTLRSTVDDLKNKLGKAIIVLALVESGKVQLMAGVTKNCTDKFSAVELVNFVAEKIGGKGGGRVDLAQAGGTDPSRLLEALNSVVGWVEGKR